MAKFVLLYTILYYTILYYTVSSYTMMYYTILHYTILYYTILYYTSLYCKFRYNLVTMERHRSNELYIIDAGQYYARTNLVSVE